MGKFNRALSSPASPLYPLKLFQGSRLFIQKQFLSSLHVSSTEDMAVNITAFVDFTCSVFVAIVTEGQRLADVKTSWISHTHS